MARRAGQDYPRQAGRFFDDFKIGDVYQSAVGRTVTEPDNTWFTLLTNNNNQIHFNRDYAANTEWGQPLVNSTLTLAIVTGLTVPDVSQNGIALGWDEIRLPAPVFAGDTLYAETEVTGVRASESRPGMGVVTTRTRGFNQRDEVVIEFVRQVLVWRQEAAPKPQARAVDI